MTRTGLRAGPADQAITFASLKLWSVRPIGSAVECSKGKDGADSTALKELIAEGAAVGQDSLDGVSRALRAIRMHLGMEVAFVSEFVDGERVFRLVDASSEDSPVHPGGSDPIEESYCQRVVDGRLPELLPDAGANREAASLAVTSDLPVGAHLGVPIKLRDGRVYGTFCCFSTTPDMSLTDRDVAVMRVFAELTAQQLDDEFEAKRADSAIEQRLRAVIAGEGLTVALQPIVEMTGRAVVGYEALARFVERSPDLWFAEATRLGMEVDLDLAAVRNAVRELAYLPKDVFVAVNVEPTTVISGGLASAFAGLDLGRVVLEITEHAAVESYDALAARLVPLRRRGLRLAVDDAGAGYASFRHILRLEPDVIKLDMSLTRDIHQDPARRALAHALIIFADETGSSVIAEGVETANELQVLEELGVAMAQGYHLGRPEPPTREVTGEADSTGQPPALAARSSS